MIPAAQPSIFQRITRWSLLGRWRRIGLVFVFAWFALGGIAHFAFTDAEMRIVPPWIGSPHLLVMISGACELLGAAGVVWHRSRRLAGAGLFLLTLAVTPANIYMLQDAASFDVPTWLLVLRLVLQVALLGLIAGSAIVRSSGNKTRDFPGDHRSRTRL